MYRVLFFFLSCLFICESVSADSSSIGPPGLFKYIDQTIQVESEQIQILDPFHNSSNESILELYNERGISYFAKQSYDLALADFNHILEIKVSENQTNDLIVGAALWGRALCHVCLDLTEDTAQDLKMLEYYFMKHCKCHSNFELASSSNKTSFAIIPVVQFAYPDENISAEDCRERVRGTANKLRLFVTPLIKDLAKRAIFLAFIQGLEDQGIYCCRDGSIWTTCVSPIFEKLERWNILGIPPDPAWD